MYEWMWRMDDLFSARPRESTVDTVINRIKTLLLERKLRPGDCLPPENDLAESMGVSRGTIREAMKILSAFGIVEVKRGNGTFISASSTGAVFDPLLFSLIRSDADARQLVEFREMMELNIVGLAVQHATAEDLMELEKACCAMGAVADAEYSDPEQAAQADLSFHRALGRACGNVLAEKVYCFILELFLPHIQQTYLAEQNGQRAVRLHMDILDAIRCRDMERALACTRVSIQEWSRLFGGEGDNL
jgi:GntR family transcriptional regulator, transcriptional repressor for pyruvate dehydrogenase complex